MALIEKEVSDFTVKALLMESLRMSASPFAGQVVVFLFYPADFTFICPTELEDLADLYEEFKDRCRSISVSTDSHFVHKAWHDV